MIVSEREEVTRRWRQGEARLYPIVNVRPDLYETAIRLVRSLADHLEAVPDRDALVASYLATEPRADLEAAGIDLDDVPPDMDTALVRDAAYEVRSRELTQREGLEQTARALERARRAGEPTAVLWTSGDSDLWPPFRRVEMALATGFATSISTEFDPDTMMPMYVLEAFQLDPDTGDALDAAPLAPRREFTDPDTWRSATAELRGRLLLSNEEDSDAPS